VLTANPGAILRYGEIMGIWTSKKVGQGLEIKMILWHDMSASIRQLDDLAEAYAAFRQQKLIKIER